MRNARPVPPIAQFAALHRAEGNANGDRQPHRPGRLSGKGSCDATGTDFAGRLRRTQARKKPPLSNTRGNNRQQGGNQSNRIDSRARGNAPQMLDKYKKMAHDAALNGDRVQSEYYLQFADHYFRVVADTKSRQDEARAKRDAERGNNQDDDSDDDRDDDGNDGRDSRSDNRGNQGDSRRNRGSDDDRPRRTRRRRDDENDDDSESASDEGDDSDGSDNPFTRPAKPARTRSRKKVDDGLDPSALPPAISADKDGDEDEDEKPKPRATRRRSKSDNDDASASDKALKAAS
jgi:hypothetical protein